MARKRSASSTPMCQAIRDQRLLFFDYDGRPRVVEPYCYGVTPGDEERLRAIQIGGGSSSGGFNFGKLWVVERMQNVRIADETFVPDDPNYNPDDSAMKRIICRVNKPKN